jgi:transcriptional repressor NrdR
LGRGIRKAAEKTSVTHADIETIVAEVERELRGAESIEVNSKTIGEMVAVRLKKRDKVAYIRFSSVFKQFVDLEEFERELHKLL